MKKQLITSSVFQSLAWISLFAFASPSKSEEIRQFVSASGQAMQAKLVSHRNGKVTLERADGKQFEVDPVVFGIDDQAYIKQWIASTPEKIEYLFGVSGTKTKTGGDSANLGYKRVKNEEWAYKLTITNRSKDTTSGLLVRYRLFYTNRADGEFSAGTYRGTYMKQGEAKIPGELVYNRSIELVTTSVKLDFVDYDGSGDRHKDELDGCIVQILDSKGTVLHEWSNQASPMKGRTWDNTGDIQLEPEM